MFLAGRIKFSDIPRLVKLTLQKHQKIKHPSVQDIIAADKWGRDIVLNLVKGKK
jgi:1-deoxy-D-xylulose-5-phosphate reductoisomerase